MLTFSDASLTDIPYLAANLREADRAEVVVTHDSCEEALLESFNASPQYRKAAYWCGKPAAMWGLCCYEGNDQLGCPWMLGTPDIFKWRHAFFRESRKAVAEMLQIRPVLGNIVDERYSAAIRWLRFLGFTITNKVVFPDEEHGFIFVEYRK